MTVGLDDATVENVLALVKAFLKAGVMTTTGDREQTLTGTPQGSLCVAEHKQPYDQRWLMPSAGLFCLVRGGPVVQRCA